MSDKTGPSSAKRDHAGRERGADKQHAGQTVRFEWDEHGCSEFAVAVQERDHADSGELIAAMIHRAWQTELPAKTSRSA